jgi:hypothetical protein
VYFLSNEPKDKIPRPWPWVKESSPEGRQAKLVVGERHGFVRGYLLDSSGFDSPLSSTEV